ncbi:MAG TPA: hypothetical protein VIA45_10715 [Thermoanaerobaculia bacterium]|jgi:hypothetical protein
MKVKAILASVGSFLAVAALSLAADPMMGTWKLNAAKSKYAAGATMNDTVTYTMAGDMVKCTVDGKDKDGKATHSEWTGKFDGKDYAVTGDATSDTRAYTKVDSDNYTMTIKKGGKPVGSGKIAIAPDGKTRTVTTSVMDSMGMKMDNTAVYDKQ